jgi:hypothetical protein
MDTSTEPNCPACRAAWSRGFLNEQLSAAFRNGPFKLYREKVLVDRERARFPETQEQAAAYKEAVDTLKPIDEQLAVLKQRLATLPELEAYTATMKAVRESRGTQTYNEWRYSPETSRLYGDLNAHSIALRNAERPLRIQYRALNKNTRTHRHIKSSFGLPPRTNVVVPGQVGEAVVVEPRPVFVHKCPIESCEGFLNAQWNCGLCKTKICKDCHEPKTETNLHLCDPELVESIKMIRKEAKPCPKCASQISKIDGCDQMWCTQCQTAFSWNTGRIETNVIHNPHYFQWRRENGGMPRGDMPFNPCAGHALDARLQQLNVDPNKDLTTILTRYLRLFRHFQHVDIPSYRRTIESNEGDEWRRQLRVQRMTNEITDKVWKTTLQRKEKETLKTRERLQLLDMYAATGMDILGQVMTSDDLEKIRDQLKTLFEFTEKAATTLSDTYNCVSLQLDPKEREVVYVH